MTRSRARTRILYGAAAAIVFAAVLGVVQWLKPAHRQFAKVDDWYTGSPDPGAWEELERDQVLPVTHDLRLGVAVHLKEQSWKEITREDAQTLSGSRLSVDPKLKPFLVRGIQLSRYHHQLSAHIAPNHDVWVETEAVSRWPLPMLKRPAILLLEQSPREVYVDAVVRDNQQSSEVSE